MRPGIIVELQDADRSRLEAICAELNQSSDGPKDGTQKARHFATNQELLEAALAASREADNHPCLAVFFTNGSFDGVIGEFVEKA